jgi:hypothetical protein
VRDRTAVLVVVDSAACGGDDADDPQETKVAGIPVLDGYTSGPGSDLGDGFTVVDGSVLLGDVVPSGAEVEYEDKSKTHFRSVSWFMPSWRPIEVIAAHCEE